jgi:lysozyme
MGSKILDIIIPFLKQWEGCKLKAYTDQGGRVTIGWGHTGGVKLGDEWSQEQADEELRREVNEVISQVQGLVKVPVTDSQLAALTSFTYNLGINNLKRSGLLRFLNLRKYETASEQFPLWSYIGLYKSPGLLARREAEKALFMKGSSEDI